MDLYSQCQIHSLRLSPIQEFKHEHISSLGILPLYLGAKVLISKTDKHCKGKWTHILQGKNESKRKNKYYCVFLLKFNAHFSNEIALAARKESKTKLLCITDNGCSLMEYSLRHEG